MENRNYFYEFKNLVDTTVDNEDTQLYGLKNGVLQTINRAAWDRDIRPTLNTFSGNLVILSKEHSSDRLETILRTYGVWAIENIHEDMDIRKWVSEWNNYETNEKKELIKKKFQFILQGQLIVLCGSFPDMAIDLDAIFEGAMIDAHPKCPSNMIAIIKFLLNHASQRLSNIEGDIFIKYQNCSTTFPLRSAYCNSYLESTRSEILELQEIFLKTTDSLQIMINNLRCYCTSNTPRGTIELLKAQGTRRYNDAAIVIEKMHNIAQALQENRKKLFKSVKKKLRVIYSAVGSIGTGIFFIVHSENNLVEKYVKLVTSCIVTVLVLLDLFIVFFVDKWKIKYRKEVDLEANVEATIPWWLRIRIWLLSIVVRMFPRNIADITNRIRSA